MKLPHAEIEQAVSSSPSRYTLQSVLLDVEAKRLVATDGHILATVPVEPDTEDHRWLIPIAAIKEARRMAKANKLTNTTLKVNGRATVTSGEQQATFDLELGQFPNYQAVMAKMEGAATITLNASLLLRLAKALDNREPSEKSRSKDVIVSLWIHGPSQGVGVKATGSENAGVIMPCKA